MGQHVAIYTRLSKDRTGRAENVASQERRGRAYASEHWSGVPVEVYTDNHLTAADEDVHRPRFDALRVAVRSGRVAAVWAVEQTRLERVEARWFTFAAELLAAGIDEVHTRRDGIVRLDEVAGIKAVLAAAEIRRLKQRIRDTLDDRAAEGRPPGGRSYGYCHVASEDGRKALEIIPEEAETARWAADAVLAGWSLTNVARELTKRGAPTARGGKWQTATVRSMLLSPTIAGLRVHRGEVVGRGDWEPIIDADTQAALRALLTQPRTVRAVDGTDRHVSRRRSTARRYLLTGGLARCGRCGAALIAQHRRGKSGERSPAYLCHASRGGCNGLGISAEGLEEYVVGRLLDALDSDEFRAAWADDDHDAPRRSITSQLEEVEARRSELAGRWAAGQLSGGEWDAARSVLDEQHARLSGELNALPPPTFDVDPALVRAGWAAMTLDERRQVLHMFLVAVLVGPAKPGTRRFDPGRVTVEWR